MSDIKLIEIICAVVTLTIFAYWNLSTIINADRKKGKKESDRLASLARLTQDSQDSQESNGEVDETKKR